MNPSGVAHTRTIYHAFQTVSVVCQVAAVRLMHNVLGGTIDPHAAWMVLRGLKTLTLRVKQQNTSAMLLARRLEAHSKVAAVHYPGATRLQRRHRLDVQCGQITAH